MKKIKTVFVILGWFIYLPCHSQSFLKRLTITPAYSTSMNPYIYPGRIEVDTIRSSSFIVAGDYRRAFGINSQDTLLSDAYLIKNQTNGLTNWIRKFHVTDSWTTITDVGVLHNHDILTIGNSRRWSSLGGFGFIMRTDTNGFIKSFERLENHWMTKLLVMKDNKVALLSSDSLGYINIALMTKNAQLIWNKRLYDADTTDSYSANELVEGVNKSILIAGARVYDPQYITFQPYVLLCDSNGTKINDMTVSSFGNWSNAVNDGNKGFYMHTDGYFLNYRWHPSVLRLDNQLQVKWQKYYRSNYRHAEFINGITYGRNNLNLLTFVNQYSSDTSGNAMTFIDSMGIVRRSVLFDSAHSIAKTLSLPKGKILFTMYTNGGHVFGITDTSTSGFCYKDTVTWVSRDTTGVNYNYNIMVNHPLLFLKDTVYTYLPKDAHILYSCSTGPTAPLDTNIIISIKKNGELNVGARMIKVYPNPANDQVTLDAELRPDEPLTVTLTDTSGRIIERSSTVVQQLPHSIQTADLENGLYVLKVDDEKGSAYYYKLLVCH